MKMRVSDYLTQELSKKSGNKVFMITGGMIMFLTDAVYKMNKKNNLDFYCFHHEQAATMAAEAYARSTGKLGVTYVTAGPAALNTLTGITGAYVDRSPCIVVSGQSKLEQAKITIPRQFSQQGFNTLPIFKNVTKYAVILDDIKTVKYEIQKAIHIALEQPLGPVWIECPIDIQGSFFDPDDYDGFIKNEKKQVYSDASIDLIVEKLKSANRPSILSGAGIRQSGSIDNLHKLTELLKIPMMTTRMGMDVIDHQYEYFVGKPGTYGDRTGNYTAQNSDVLLILGCRLSIGVIGHSYKDFAPDTTKIIIDVDPKEFQKPSIRESDICIEADLEEFLPKLIKSIEKSNYDSIKYKQWLKCTKTWKDKYPVDLPEYKKLDEINSYHFMSEFSQKVDSNALFAVDTGSCFHVHAQAFQVKYGQRHIITGGLSTMGYAPSSIGVAVSVSDNKDKHVYCISGDGSIQMNLQEFQTISHYKLPVKTIILNNDGYLLIRHSQNNFCESRLIGESNKNGVSFPSMEKVAKLYNIKYISIKNTKELHLKIDELISHSGPLICEVFTLREQLLIPRVAAKTLKDGSIQSMPYDDMFPFLPRKEYNDNVTMAKKCTS